MGLRRRGSTLAKEKDINLFKEILSLFRSHEEKWAVILLKA